MLNLEFKRHFLSAQCFLFFIIFFFYFWFLSLSISLSLGVYFLVLLSVVIANFILCYVIHLVFKAPASFDAFKMLFWICFNNFRTKLKFQINCCSNEIHNDSIKCCHIVSESVESNWVFFYFISLFFFSLERVVHERAREKSHSTDVLGRAFQMYTLSIVHESASHTQPPINAINL